MVKDHKNMLKCCILVLYSIKYIAKLKFLGKLHLNITPKSALLSANNKC